MPTGLLEESQSFGGNACPRVTDQHLPGGASLTCEHAQGRSLSTGLDQGADGRFPSERQTVAEYRRPYPAMMQLAAPLTGSFQAHI